MSFTRLSTCVHLTAVFSLYQLHSVGGGDMDVVHKTINVCAPDRCVFVVATFPDSPAMSKPDAISSDDIGKYYIIVYDEKPYPGIIFDVDDGDVKIKCMASLEKIYFFGQHPRYTIKICFVFHLTLECWYYGSLSGLTF